MHKLSFFLMLCFFGLFSEQVFSQDKKILLERVQSVLKSKGLDEDEVKQRLRSRGYDVENMSQQELMNNQRQIEDIVTELENEKKRNSQAKPAVSAGVVKSVTETSKASTETILVDNVAVAVSKKEIAAEALSSQVLNVPPSKIYGHDIFSEKSLEIYRVSKDASPPDNYILAPGDKINILIFGKSQADLMFEINTAGFIQPTQMPKIFLSGLTLKQAKQLLISKFSAFYVFDQGQFALTLNTSRTLSVNIFGEVVKAGSYTTSALNSALGALASAGGPTEIGSVRNIQLVRSGVKKVLDIYAFLRNPALQFDFFLQNNDIIYVPAAEKLVSIEGAVKRPMQYELKSTEGLLELLDYAGGLRVDAFTEIVQIQRYENNKINLYDFNLAEILAGKKQLKIFNGDIIRIKSINAPLKTYVKASGAFSYPGDYELLSTPSLQKLLLKAKLKPEAKLEQAFLIRKRKDQSKEVISLQLDTYLKSSQSDINFQEEDELLVFEQQRYADQFSIAVLGEVRAPFERLFPYDAKITIKEALGLASGLKPEAADKGYIYRTDPFDSKRTKYLEIDINEQSSAILKPGDRLVVLNKSNYVLESSISILGDVKNATSLRFDSSLRIKDLIRIAGGVTLSTDISFAEVFRLSFEIGKPVARTLLKVALSSDYLVKDSNFHLQPFDLIVLRKQPEFGLQETVSIVGEVIKQGPFLLKNRTYRFSDLINDAGGFTRYADIFNVSLIRYVSNIGLIAFDAREALRYKGDAKKDPILYDKDYIMVPRISNTVTISPSGTQYELANGQNDINIVYQGRYSAVRYIKNYAGGFAKLESGRYLKIIHQNGIQESTRKWLFFKKHPKVMQGDRIVILQFTKEEKKRMESKPVDWDKITSRLIAVFSALALIQAYVK